MVGAGGGIAVLLRDRFCTNALRCLRMSCCFHCLLLFLLTDYEIIEFELGLLEHDPKVQGG